MAARSFRGTSAGQDARFADKMALVRRRIAARAPPEYAVPIDTSRVRMEVINKWVADKLTEFMGLEDEVLIGMVHAMLAEPVSTSRAPPKPGSHAADARGDSVHTSHTRVRRVDDRWPGPQSRGGAAPTPCRNAPTCAPA